MSDETEPSSPSATPPAGFPIPPVPGTPQRTSVPAPIPGSGTPAEPSPIPTDEDRQAVIATVQQALAEDLLHFEDVDERFALIYAAETQADLRAATADLPDLRRPPPRPEGRHLAPSTSVNLIGDTKISGWLAVDGDISVISLIGDVLVDLSTAEIPAEGIAITAIGVIGDIKVILPDGVRVQPQAFSLIGSTKTSLSPPLTGQPTIRVRGVQVIGDTAVYSLSEIPEGPLRRLWAKLRGDSAKD